MKCHIHKNDGSVLKNFIHPLHFMVVMVQLIFLVVSYEAFAGLTNLTGIMDQREGCIIRGSRSDRLLSLVFTGHEYGEGASAILDALTDKKINASFFLTGAYLAHTQYNESVKRMVEEGHYLGPHSDAHLLYCSWDKTKQTLVSKATFLADLTANQQKIARQHPGTQNLSRFFLPPYEHFNSEIARWTAEAGYTLINYTPGTLSHADYTEEGASNFVSSEAIFNSILAYESRNPQGLNGFILLMHVGAGPRRADKFYLRLPALLDILAAKGYRFVRVDELLKSAAQLPKPIYIRANQLGYRPADFKVAVAFSEDSLPEFYTVEGIPSGNKVYQGPVRKMNGAQWGRFPYHAELDFTALSIEGAYRLVAGNHKSLPFEIGKKVYASMPDAGLDFMRQQRCGANPWLDVLCHQEDGRTAYGPLPAGSKLDARGGWHDAGDMLKYLLTSGNATAQLLLAWQLRPQSFQYHDLVDAMGKSGANGIPDILDEARWGLDWMLKLHPAPDQLYHQVADDRDHIGLRLPQNDTADYGWGRGGPRVVYAADGCPQGLAQYKSESSGMANLAGRHAAALALAWQIWKDHPKLSDFAARCLEAAKSAYALGRKHEGVQQGNSVKAPYRYEETTWADDMEWGAAELYLATKDARYLDEASNYARMAGSDSWMGLQQTKHYQYYPFFNLGHYRLHQSATADLRKELENYYREGIERCAAASRQNPYRAGVPFIWCSANLTVALATQGILYQRMAGDTQYALFTAQQRDWLLGRNPWEHTFITEVGSIYPTEVHLQTTRLTGRRIKGGLVDGPVYERIFKSLRGVSISEPDPLAFFQDSRAVYHNDFNDYSSNEPTMDGTASAILLWTLLAGESP